ncbi:TPA: DUF551 domain-containing protein [Klebsiella quasipneumoniae]
MKDHEIRELVNQLRDIAIEYHSAGQLREKIARTVRAAILQAQSDDDGEPTDDERIMAIEGIHNCERCSDEGWVIGEMGITRCACGQAGNFRENANSSTNNCREIPETSTNAPVIPDGYVMVPKEPTEAMMLHNSGCQHHAWDDPDCAMRQTRRLIWSHMLAAAPQLPGSERATVPGKWIPVSERLPEAGGDMIVFTDGIVMSGVSYAKKKGFYIQALEYDDDEPVDSVTHWMPLPAGPQEPKP